MQTILITGAGRGLGFEFARQFAADGWRVLATLRDPAQGDRLAALGPTVEIHPLDVADRDSVKRLGQALAGRPIDILLCNAAVYGQRHAPVGQMNYESWAETFALNVMGPMALVEAFVDNVAASDRKTIVMLSSRMASITHAVETSTIYRTSKAALNMLAKNLAAQLRARGIIVVPVDPGWVRTDMGGPKAPLAPEESIGQFKSLITRLRPEDSGTFFRYDGETNPW